jgi:NAD(P)-dependent dehydrogenase (short-subunit alcohol dehydrogenase family)
MKIEGKVAVVTGAASGIGEATAQELARRGVKGLALVDRSGHVAEVARSINQMLGRPVAEAFIGDTTDSPFRGQVFDKLLAKHGTVNICVPAAGITRDSLTVKIDKETGRALIYPVEQFRHVIEINLIAPVYWAMEMVGRVAEERRRRGLGRWEPSEKLWGTIVFIGSVSAQGNKGQIAYAASKAGVEGAAATLMKEAIFHGVKCAVIHPGFTDTPMVHALGEDFIAKNILPYTQLRRLIRPDEIADGICFLIANSAASGELWADAGWHPSA